MTRYRTFSVSVSAVDSSNTVFGDMVIVDCG